MIRGGLILVVVPLIASCSAHDDPHVAGPQQARQAVLEHLELKVNANHGFHVSPLLCLGADLGGFGKAGDPVWEIRRSDLHAGMAIDGLFWVNGRTGKVRQLHPLVIQPTGRGSEQE